MNKNVQTFIACESNFEDARAVIFGAPFDGTTSFRPGTRFGPSAMMGLKPIARIKIVTLKISVYLTAVICIYPLGIQRLCLI